MIPNHYKMSGELLPGVCMSQQEQLPPCSFNLRRSSGCYGMPQTGVVMLASSNVQEAMDLGCIAHLSAHKGKTPLPSFLTASDLS